MYSGCKVLVLLTFFPLLPGLVRAGHAGPLRVCADPNNLPYSDSASGGYEIELAQLTAKELSRPVQFVWITQRGEYLRKTLFAGKCDVLMSLPTSLEAVLTTRPYYRSSYVFVSRRDRHLNVRSFDDPRLKTPRIGVQILQNEAGSATPAAQALMDRQLSSNIIWYKIFSNFSRRNPAAGLIEGVEHGDIDVAVAWGPVAGYCARNAPVALEIAPVSPQVANRSIPLAFDISMGVRPGDTTLCSDLNTVINRRKGDIGRLLAKYGVTVTAAPLEHASAAPFSVAARTSSKP